MSPASFTSIVPVAQKTMTRTSTINAMTAPIVTGYAPTVVMGCKLASYFGY